MREEADRYDVGRVELVRTLPVFADEFRSQIRASSSAWASVDWRRLRYTMDERYVDARPHGFRRPL